MNEIELKRLIENKYGSVRAFSIENEIPYTTMRSILERGVLNAKAETIFKICSILKIRPEAFGFLLPELSTTAPNSLVEQISDKVVQLTEPNQKSVLRYSSELLDKQNTVAYSKNTVNELQATYHTYNYYEQPASAGTGQYLNDVQVEQIELPINVNADFVVPIYGDSMEPEYHSGDYIFVKLSVDLSDGDIGVFAYNGDAYIKQLRITDQGAYLHSLNPDYDDIPITADTDFRTIGEVVGIYRES
ncbi:TPA: helix-turn-helix transcriptional regulator [Streptococcus suis]|uniref:S24 family peptidase n=1 Tax=Streptococcus suis TaxID=1307 RepID=UPI000A4F374D|nr:S24 family peptidase [Streptococcus suis]MCB2923480.1 helix-turn-helix transcriptional regulator [Streptococcus suis]MCB2927605.1 helix-turn-helix transcriptional regulator [Streptococcus suis]MCG9906262.1 S24 family peptidase [Streptococcus suis]HEL1590604.1 helix-turn-helix transcriptional regulator [Streptococcus suis]HEL1682876.1 helix-turn-helix transcriptional regulator [Streptococcus suis]